MEGSKQKQHQWDRIVQYMGLELLLHLVDAETYALEPEEVAYICDEISEWLSQRKGDKRRE